MTAALALSEANDLRAEIKAMTEQQLRKEIGTAFNATAVNYLRLALLVRELEERGHDLANWNSRILVELRLVAHGQLSARALAQFIGSPLILDKVRALPMPDQEKLADGGSIKLLTRDDKGGFTHRMVQPLEMTPEQVSQAFTRGAIRTEAEQINYLESKRKLEKHGKTDRTGCSPCPERGGVLAGRKFIAKEDVLRAVAGCGTKETDDKLTEGIGGKFLTDAEYKRLSHSAAESGKKPQEVVRWALRATGII